MVIQDCPLYTGLVLRANHSIDWPMMAHSIFYRLDPGHKVQLTVDCTQLIKQPTGPKILSWPTILFAGDGSVAQSSGSISLALHRWILLVSKKYFFCYKYVTKWLFARPAPWEPSVWAAERLKQSSAALPLSPVKPRSTPTTHPPIPGKHAFGPESLAGQRPITARHAGADQWDSPILGCAVLCGRGWWAERAQPRGFSRGLEIGGKVAWWKSVWIVTISDLFRVVGCSRGQAEAG